MGYSGERHTREDHTTTVGHVAVPIVGAIVMAIIATIDFWRHMFNQGPGHYQGDIRTHAAIAQALFGGSDALFEPGALRNTVIPPYLKPGQVPPHPGLHLATRAVAFVTRMDVRHAMVWLLVVAVAVTFVLTYLMLRAFTNLPPWIASAFAVVLGIVSAIWVPAFNKHIYFGQGTPNIWHSPTQVLLVPFALATIWAAMLWLARPSRGLLIAIGALTAVSAIVKPNFALVFVPALLCVVTIEALRQHDATQLRDVVVAFIPLAVVLLIQFHIAATGNGGGIRIDPFFIVRRGTPSWEISMLLVLAFPLSVIVIFPQALRDRSVQLAWLITLVGFLERALLVEAKRPGHGNWSWGYFVAVKILFVVSAIALFRRDWWRKPASALPLAALALSFLSGIVYLDHLITGKGYF
jgi:hypothetical protein